MPFLNSCKQINIFTFKNHVFDGIIFNFMRFNHIFKDLTSFMKRKTHIDSGNSVSTLSLLRNMGAGTFVYFYLPLKEHKNLDANTLASYCPTNANWTDESRRTKACTARRIFKEGREKEALELVLGMNLPPDLHNMANQYLDELAGSNME